MTLDPNDFAAVSKAKSLIQDPGSVLKGGTLMNQIIRRKRIEKFARIEQSKRIKDLSESEILFQPDANFESSTQNQYWTDATLQLEILGPDGRLVVQLNQPFARIGSHPGSDVRLSLPGVERKQLYLHVVNDKIVGIDFASSVENGKRWGLKNLAGRPITCGPYVITPGVVQPKSNNASENLAEKSSEGLNNGSRSLDSVNHGGAESIAFNARIRLKDKAPFNYPLPNRLFSVGRHPTNKVSIRSSWISPFHCVIFKTNDEIWVVDLLANNQTRVNGECIDCVRMPVNGRMEFGPTTIKFEKAELSSAMADSREEVESSLAGRECEPIQNDYGKGNKVARVADRTVVRELFEMLEWHIDEVRKAKAQLVVEQNRLSRERSTFENQLATWSELRKRQLAALEHVRTEQAKHQARLTNLEACKPLPTAIEYQPLSDPSPDSTAKNVPPKVASKRSRWRSFEWGKEPPLKTPDERQLDVLSNIKRLGRK